MKPEFFYLALGLWMVFALILLPVQIRVAAPYGRHTKTSWGPMINNRLGWMAMEIISPLSLLFWLWKGTAAFSPALVVLVVLWLLHYLNRSVIFPLRIHTRGKQMPLAIALSAGFFNVANGFFNGYWWGFIADPYPADYLYDPRMVFGALLFLAGVWINHRADTMLIALRKPGETGYSIPKGWLFQYISCPNHFGEILEWLGFAIMAWNLPAFSFALWTAANLIPRALAHHRWYRAQFDNYPAERKAVIPGLL